MRHACDSDGRGDRAGAATMTSRRSVSCDFPDLSGSARGGGGGGAGSAEHLKYVWRDIFVPLLI